MDLTGQTSFTANYFSMDDIIASQIKIPCRTETVLPQFGFLDASLNMTDLPEGAEVELPLWVAQVMSKPSRRYVTVSVPNKYKEAHRDVLKADSGVVDLNKMGPHFYQSALHLSALPHPETERIAEILPEVLQRRLLLMSDSYSFITQFHSADKTIEAQDTSNLMKESHMDALEHRIYTDAKNGADSMRGWLETVDKKRLQ